MQASDPTRYTFWRRLWNLVIFLVLLALLINVSQFVLWQDIINTKRERVMLHPRGKPEVLVLGNSHLGYGIQDKVLENLTGVEVDVLEGGGISIQEAYYLLEQALKESDPQLVVIETFLWEPFSDTGTYKLTYDSLPQALPALVDTYAPEDILRGWFPILESHVNWLYQREGVILNIHRLVEGYEDELNDALDDIRFRGQNDTILSQDDYDAVLGKLDPWRSYPEPPIEIMQRFQALTEKEGCQLMFLKIPTVDSYGVVDSVISEPTAELGIPFLDLNLSLEEPALDRVHVYNAAIMPSYVSGFNSHLNNAGSLAASLSFAEAIAQALELPTDLQAMAFYRQFLLENLETEKVGREITYTLIPVEPQTSVQVSWVLEEILPSGEVVLIESGEGFSITIPAIYNSPRYQLRYSMTQDELSQSLGIGFTAHGTLPLGE